LIGRCEIVGRFRFWEEYPAKGFKLKAHEFTGNDSPHPLLGAEPKTFRADAERPLNGLASRPQGLLTQLIVKKEIDGGGGADLVVTDAGNYRFKHLL